jgi:hypothetical protein
MFRLTALLGVGIYLALLVGGQDRGQQRFGLMQAQAPAPQAAAPVAAAAPAVPPAPAAEAAAVPEAPVARRAVPEGVASLPLVVPASYSEPEEPPTFSLSDPVADGGAMAFAATAMVLDPQAAAAVTRPPAEGAATAANVIRVVIGSSVNVREGPSTEAAVLGKLVRGEEVLVIRAEANGWARVRIEGDGIEGFVATRFLSED